MHPNTSTATLLYKQTASLPSAYPTSKMKRSKSNINNLNTVFGCSNTTNCNCFCCKIKDNGYFVVDETNDNDDWNFIFLKDN